MAIISREKVTPVDSENPESREKYRSEQNNPYQYQNKTYGRRSHKLLITLATIILIIFTFTFTHIYNILPFVATVLLLINILKYASLQRFPFRWFVLNLVTILVVFSTLFLPVDVKSIFNSIGPIQLQNFPALLDWLMSPFHLLQNIFIGQPWGAMQIMLIARILFFLILIFRLAKNIFVPNFHVVEHKSHFTSTIIQLIIFAIALNADIFWPMILSMYNAIKLWFFPNQPMN